MGVDTVNPQYEVISPDWRQMRDTRAGERKVKDGGVLYLPATTGQRQRSAGPVSTPQNTPTGEGGEQYQAYKCRAHFPEFVDDTVTTMVGLLNFKPPTITLPEKLEPMRENATAKGETLEQLLRRIHDEQLTVGRYGLLLEVPDGRPATEDMPFIVTYVAERITNWDDGVREQGKQELEYVVLTETELERVSGFDFESQTKYRVLMRANQLEGVNLTNQDENVADGTYIVAILPDGSTEVASAEVVVPEIRGQSLMEIPFCFINSIDIVPDVDKPPLLGLSNLSLTGYRGDADYRQALFGQGQDTLVVIGGDEDEERLLGVGASIELPIGADAKFIGIDSKGLPEMRTALENVNAQAALAGAHLLDTSGRGAESGEALRIRVAAKTPTLVSLARTAAGGLEKLLKIAAEWVGADPDEVSVQPNLEFVAREIKPKDVIDFMAAKSLGAPITQADVHEWLKQREFTQNTFDETKDELEAEGAAALEADGAAGV